MIDIHPEAAEKAATLKTLRRQVMAAMETGNEGLARTIVTELREVDFAAGNALRIEVVRAYGNDL